MSDYIAGSGCYARSKASVWKGVLGNPYTSPVLGYWSAPSMLEDIPSVSLSISQFDMSLAARISDSSHFYLAEDVPSVFDSVCGDHHL